MTPDPATRAARTMCDYVDPMHDTYVHWDITYQGSHQLPTAQAFCRDCEWSGPLRTGDPDEASNDAAQHERDTDPTEDCPRCGGSGRVPTTEDAG